MRRFDRRLLQPPTPGLASAGEIVRDVLERRAQFRAEGAYRRNENDPDEGCDETVFDGCRAALIAMCTKAWSLV